MNSINLIGTLGRDPEPKATSGGTQLTKFSVAVNDGFGDKKHVSWFDVTAFSKTAEFVDKYFKKGSKIAITGRLTQETWTSKEGEKRSKVAIIAERVTFADSKGTREPGSDDFDAPAAKDEEF